MNRRMLIPLIGVCCGWLAVTGCKRHGGPPQQRVPEVSVVEVQEESIRITSELPGRTTAFLVAEIRPQVSGLIQKRLFDEGTEVKAGQVLYQIDPAPFQAALDSAEASLAQTEAALSAIRPRVERYEELLTHKAISRQEYDDATAALKQAEAQIQASKAAVEVARINLQYTSIKAPISGRIGKSTVTEGALVIAFQPIALSTIQQLDPIYVDVPQSTTELLSLQRQMAAGHLQREGKNQNDVQLILPDGASYAEKGILQFQDITVDPTTGTVILRAVFPNPDGVLLPGMFVRAVVVKGVDEQAILVPQQSVSRTPQGDPFVLVVDKEGKVLQQMVTIERAVGSRWHVSSGLKPGDRVIVEGTQRARPGATVNAVPFETNQARDESPSPTK